MPLLSLSASGTFAGLFTFSNRATGQQVRVQKKQKDKITSARTTHRNKFLSARSMWPLNDFGVYQFGFNLFGGRDVHIASLPIAKRAPQFARWVSDVLTFYF